VKTKKWPHIGHGWQQALEVQQVLNFCDLHPPLLGEGAKNLSGRFARPQSAEQNPHPVTRAADAETLRSKVTFPRPHH